MLKKREGSGELRCVPLHYYGAIQSHCSILSHDRLHHHLSGNNGLVNGDRELGHLFCYYRNCKNTLTILLGEHAHFVTGISRVQIWLRHLANCIPVGHDVYSSSQDPSLFFFFFFAEVGLACGTKVILSASVIIYHTG